MLVNFNAQQASVSQVRSFYDHAPWLPVFFRSVSRHIPFAGCGTALEVERVDSGTRSKNRRSGKGDAQSSHSVEAGSYGGRLGHADGGPALRDALGCGRPQDEARSRKSSGGFYLSSTEGGRAGR